MFIRQEHANSSNETALDMLKVI